MRRPARIAILRPLCRLKRFACRIHLPQRKVLPLPWRWATWARRHPRRLEIMHWREPRPAGRSPGQCHRGKATIRCSRGRFADGLQLGRQNRLANKSSLSVGRVFPIGPTYRGRFGSIGCRHRWDQTGVGLQADNSQHARHTTIAVFRYRHVRQPVATATADPTELRG